MMTLQNRTVTSIQQAKAALKIKVQEGDATMIHEAS
jgi:hypothetical protein